MEREAGILAQPLTNWHLPNPSLSGIATFLNVDKKFFLIFGLVWLTRANTTVCQSGPGMPVSRLCDRLTELLA